jgi:N-sulfoglucosamine sulfohydrolase
LKKAGYTTGIIGKLHVNPESAFPFDFEAISSANFGRKNMSKYAEEASSFISKSEKPFFLQVNYPDAHAPFIRQVDGLPKNPLNAEDVEALPYMGVDHPRLKEMTANYYNCMMRLDTYIGDLIKVLKKSGKYNNTLIVYIGDHGADILRGKRTSYEGGIKIPMIVNWPNKQLKKIRSKELVSTIDLFPTFLETAGLSIPTYLPGKSLLPLLSQENTGWRKYLFTEYHVHSNHNPYPQRTVRNKKYKLIYNLVSGTENPGYDFTFNKLIKKDPSEILNNATTEVKEAYQRMKNPPKFELYDLEKDPYEFTNLSENEDYKKTLEQLKSVLNNWQIETNDPLIDEGKAKKLFDLIIETGTNKKSRITVPYSDIMDVD